MAAGVGADDGHTTWRYLFAGADDRQWHVVRHRHRVCYCGSRGDHPLRRQAKTWVCYNDGERPRDLMSCRSISGVKCERSVVLCMSPRAARPESMSFGQDTTVSSLEWLGEAGWLPDVRSDRRIHSGPGVQPASAERGVRAEGSMEGSARLAHPLSTVAASIGWLYLYSR